MNWKRIQETCKTAVRRAAAPWARTSPPVPAPLADEFARASTYTASYRWGAHGEAFVARNGGQRGSSASATGLARSTPNGARAERAGKKPRADSADRPLAAAPPHAASATAGAVRAAPQTRREFDRKLRGAARRPGR